MILVTGATGFVGSELLCLLVKKDLLIVGLYRNENQKEKVKLLIKSRHKEGEKFLKKILWRKGNLKDFSSLEDAFKGVTKVYHCAALVSMAHKDAKRLFQVNQKGTSYIVNLCIKYKVKKMLYVSSIAALGYDKSENEINEWSWGWSEATFEHKAFQYWGPKNLLAIPLSTYRQTYIENDEEAKEGIFSHLAQMSENELRELYGGYLVPKGYREQDIMEMPMKELEYLFNQVMGT